MEWKTFLTAFLTIFLAELGDKTQLAAITMTAKSNAPLAVFLGASLGLILVTILAVLFGTFVTQYVPTDLLQKIVAVAFILIGVLMLFKVL